MAICAGSDVVHPVGALAIGAAAGALFVWSFNLAQKRLRVDDVLGVWPLHGLCGLWGGIAAGIFGLQDLGGLGGVSLGAQVVGSLVGVTIAVVGGALVYGVLKATVGIRLTRDEEAMGADLAIHKVSAYPETDIPGRQ